MPRVFRQRYSIPVPDGATPATVKDPRGRQRPAVRFPGPDGKPAVAPLTKDGGRCLVPSASWYGWVPDPEASGGRRREKLCTNKAAAEQLLAKLILKAEQTKVHGPDPYEKHRGRPLAEHLADFLRHLEAKGDPRPTSAWSARASPSCSPAAAGAPAPTCPPPRPRPVWRTCGSPVAAACRPWNLRRRCTLRRRPPRSASSRCR
jgi:hypothetical protein